MRGGEAVQLGDARGILEAVGDTGEEQRLIRTYPRKGVRSDEQRAKAERLRVRDGFTNVKCLKGYIEEVPLPDGTADVVVSNGVINLAVDKARVFREAARLLRAGGRLALSDIVTEARLPETITCDTSLWAACIGGAAQRDDYRSRIEAAGLRVMRQEENPKYAFISENARRASRKFGVKSVSLLAVKAPGN